MIERINMKGYSAITISLFYGSLLFRFVSDPFNSSALNIVINLMILSVGLFILMSSRVAIIKTEAKTSLVSVVVLILIILLNVGADLDYAVSEYLRVFFLLLLINVFYFMYSRGFFIHTLRAFLYINCMLILIGFFNVLTGDYRIVEGVSRLNGTYSHPNPYGMHLMLVLMLCSGLYLSGYHRKAMVFIGLASFFVFTQIFNFSALLAVVLFFALYAFLEKRHEWSFGQYVFYPLITLASFYFLYLTSSVLSDRIDLLISTGLVSDQGYAVNSVQWRVMNWTYYLENIDNIIIGNGVGASDAFYSMRHNTTFTVLAPHNEWLKILFEYGLLGLGGLLLVLVKILSGVGNLSKAILFSFLFACFFDNFFKSTSLIIMVALSILFLESLRHHDE